MKKVHYLFLLMVCLLLSLCSENPSSINAQELDYKPRILIITAHPDDEVVFSATIFKATHLLNGVVDIANVTNGEGGYRYSTLANYIYELKLDQEDIGRANLPEIRKKELMAAGEILGLNEYFFLNQVDDMSSTDINIPLTNWDTDFVESELTRIIGEGDYDFIFTMIPYPTTHSHHQATTLLSLRAVQNIASEQRPIILGQGSGDFEMLAGFTLTSINKDLEPLIFDRSQTFGFDNRLDYSIIAQWVIAEHKSQGLYQLSNGRGIETFNFYEINPESAYQKTKEFFEAILSAKVYQ